MANRGTFQQGLSGPKVMAIQRYMLCYNSSTAYDVFTSGKTDGIYGAGTTSAVKKFQENKGIGVDGIVGPETWRTMAGTMNERVLSGVNATTIVFNANYCTGNSAIGFTNRNGDILLAIRDINMVAYVYNTDGSSTLNSFQFPW